MCRELVSEEEFQKMGAQTAAGIAQAVPGVMAAARNTASGGTTSARGQHDKYLQAGAYLTTGIAAGIADTAAQAAARRVEPEYISKQISSGEMTINQAREAVWKPRHDDPRADEYIISEEFCNSENADWKEILCRAVVSSICASVASVITVIVAKLIGAV